ncbi:MAG: HAD hydrolase-like protein [Thermoanaerobaculia bacterium]
MGPLAAVAFDLDGTLIDSREDLARGVNLLRGELGLPPLPLEQVITFVGDGALALVRRSLEIDRPGLTAEPLLPRFLELYDRVCLERTRAYPGIPALLEELRPRLPLAVLTNKPEAISRRILQSLGLASHFQALVGGDTLAERKPHPAGLRYLAERFGCPVERLCLVGDGRRDAEAAQAAGSPVILVSWGFTAAEKLALLPASARASRPEEVAGILEGWAAAQAPARG